MESVRRPKLSSPNTFGKFFSLDFKKGGGGGGWVKLSKITSRIYFVFISVFLYSIFGSVAALVPNLINPNRLLRAPAYLPAHPLAPPSCPSLDYYRLIIFFSRPRCGSAGGPSKVLSTPDVEMFILLSGIWPNHEC